MNNKLLPIGSVVSLEGATKKMLILGASVKRENDATVYDYIGVPYPEGYINSETMFLFLAKDIKEIHYVGYVDAEAQAFRMKYAEHLKENGLLEDTEE